MAELLYAQLRAWLRRWLGDRSGQAELLVVLLLAFLIWVLATNRRVVIQ
jgi:NhaP-type Na+/H+ or K+/H+ antiporter